MPLGAAASSTADPFEALAEAHAIAARTGQGTAFWFVLGHTNTAQWEMSIALERGDPDRAIAVAASVSPDDIPVRSRKAAYYTDLGIALSTVKRRDVEAVEALRRLDLAP